MIKLFLSIAKITPQMGMPTSFTRKDMEDIERLLGNIEGNIARALSNRSSLEVDFYIPIWSDIVGRKVTYDCGGCGATQTQRIPVLKEYPRVACDNCHSVQTVPIVYEK